MNPQRIVQNIQQNPRKTIERAKNGPIAELVHLANFCHAVPELLSLGILDLFFHHLNGDYTPTEPTFANDHLDIANRAFMSLMGLNKIGNVIGHDSRIYSAQTKKSWPGIFKWSAFFFAVRIQPKDIDPLVRRSAVDVISGSWYQLCRIDGVQEVIVATQGSLEIATKLWQLEDKFPYAQARDIHCGSACLEALLREAESESLDRVLHSAGGKADDVAQLALSRLRSVSQEQRIPGIRMTIYTNVINQISRKPEHPLRIALLGANVIQIITKSLVTVTTQLNMTRNPDLLEAVISCFVYLRNYLDSTDGFTWVTQSIQHRLLQAFVEASPWYARVNPEERGMVVLIVQEIIPRYMVYRSVVLAMEGPMKKICESPYKEIIQKSSVGSVWSNLDRLFTERLDIIKYVRSLKGKAETCDNGHCQKVDEKKNFRKCSSCSTTLYCSRECQVKAWKEGGHKTMCKLKQQERLEFKGQSISKQDLLFLHNLSIRDAWHHIPKLRTIATHDYPNAELTSLVINIDYTTLPPAYSLVTLVSCFDRDGVTDGTPNAEARNDALLEKARDHPGKYTIIQSKISNGQNLNMVMTLVTGTFWGTGDEPHYEDDAD